MFTKSLKNYLHFLGHIITPKRSAKILVHANKLHTERDKQFAENQNKMMKAMTDIQATLLRVTSQMDMKKKVDIDDYFPINVDSDLQKFLSKDDGQFKIRREEFENWLYCHVTNNLKAKRPFESNILAAIFTRDYIRSHKWPGPT